MLLAYSRGEKKKACILMKQVAPKTAEALQSNKEYRSGFGP